MSIWESMGHPLPRATGTSTTYDQVAHAAGGIHEGTLYVTGGWGASVDDPYKLMAYDIDADSWSIVRETDDPDIDTGYGSGADQLLYPHGVAVDASGNIYIADTGNNRVQRWASGAPSGTTVAGGNGYGSGLNQLAGPRDLVVDGSGNVYVIDEYNHRVVRWASGATSGTVVAGGTYGSGLDQLAFPRGVAVDASGNVYVSDTFNHRVVRWAPGASSGTVVAGGNGAGSADNQLYYPNGVVVDGSGNVYVTGDQTRIRRWAPGATTGTVVAGTASYGLYSPGSLTLLADPRGIALDSSGRLYVVDSSVHRVIRFPSGSTSGSIGTVVAGANGAGAELNQLGTEAIGIAVDSSNNVYIADRENHRIIRWTPSATVGTVVAGRKITTVPAVLKPSLQLGGQGGIVGDTVCQLGRWLASPTWNGSSHQPIETYTNTSGLRLDIYDIPSHTWSTEYPDPGVVTRVDALGPDPAVLSGFACVSDGACLYAFGGRYDLLILGDDFANAEFPQYGIIWDPSQPAGSRWRRTSSWTSTGMHGRSGHSAVLHDGKVYLLGGVDWITDEPHGGSYGSGFDTAWTPLIYDIATDTWSLGAKFIPDSMTPNPSAPVTGAYYDYIDYNVIDDGRYDNQQSFVLNGRIYWNRGRRTYFYDPAVDRWGLGSLPQTPDPVAGAGAPARGIFGVYDGRFYLVGGRQAGDYNAFSGAHTGNVGKRVRRFSPLHLPEIGRIVVREPATRQLTELTSSYTTEELAYIDATRDVATRGQFQHDLTVDGYEPS